MVVKSRSFKERKLILQSKNQLKDARNEFGDKFFIDEQLPAAITEERR